MISILVQDPLQVCWRHADEAGCPVLLGSLPGCDFLSSEWPGLAGGPAPAAPVALEAGPCLAGG